MENSFCEPLQGFIVSFSFSRWFVLFLVNGYLHSSPYILFQISGTYHGNFVFAPAPGFINLFLIYCCQAASSVLVLF